MMDKGIRREVVEQLGAGSDRVDTQALPEGVDLGTAEPIIDGLFETWVTASAYLLTFGFSHRSLCDAASEIVSVTAEAREQSRAG